MLTKLNGCAILGVDAFLTHIEVSISNGIGCTITGLADESIRESIPRIATALEQNGFRMPRTKILVHLSPAEIRKSGSAYDLPIALGILMASGQLEDMGQLSRYLVAGEIGLDGTLNPVKGALCMSSLAAEKKMNGVIIPDENAEEAALIRETQVFPVSHLREVIAFLGNNSLIPPFRRLSATIIPSTEIEHDFKNVQGQQRLKRAAEIAAAGSHHLLMSGTPGTGKSIIAKCLPSILPPMNRMEMLETTRIHCLSNDLKRIRSLLAQRPFRTIHPTISDVALVGGGLYANPGELTMAHNGILFMDELPEFKPNVLEALRQPLEDKKVTVNRNRATAIYPANFLLVAAMNPCPCGYHHHPVRKCTCSKRAMFWYRRKISGPLLDRFDLQVESEPDNEHWFQPLEENESSHTIRQRVLKARQRQWYRFREYPGIHSNAMMTHDMIREHCVIDQHAQRLVMQKMESGELSMRGVDKILKVARTIADLAGSPTIEIAHIAEAISFRLPGSIHTQSIKNFTSPVYNLNGYGYTTF